MLRRLAGPFFILAGVMHFVIPRTYEAIMPPWLPAHRELVLASGVAEIAGGALLLAPAAKLRRLGAWWTVATMAAVFPANVHMAVNAGEYSSIPRGALYARLPIQAVFIAWAIAAGRRD
jgi:uncharacterized membrane protein